MRISLPVLALKLPDRTATRGKLALCRTRLLRSALAYFTICAALLAPSVARAGWVDGGFESGAFAPNWNVASYYNSSSGVATFPPTKKSDLGLTVKTDNKLSSVVSTGTDLPSNNALSYPKWGNKAALLNMRGDNHRVSAIDQTVTMTAADVDSADSKVHIRFAIAPVLQDPGHPPEDQPYYFVEVTNVTKGRQLFYNYHYANQPGVPWKKGSSSYLYTDWQAFDIAPGGGFLDVGDQVKLEIISAGCGQGQHEAHLYVDGIGSLFEGLRVTATGPSTAATGSDITYTYTYANNSANAAANTVIDAVMPQDMTSSPLNATFVSAVAPPGGTCTDPGVGKAGTVSCSIATLNSHASGSFQVKVHIPANASVTAPKYYLNNGNYSIRATGASPFLGSLFQTRLLAPSSSFTLSLTKAGTGVGSVVSAPAGIVCGTDCSGANMLVTNGGQVSLIASTTAGNTFAGWGGACSGTASTCTLTMDAAKSVTATFSAATTSRYTKIANNGSVLPDSALLGSGPTQWACTRDNTTGLLWEVKTADGGLRDLNRSYTNYDDPTQVRILVGSDWVNLTQAEIDAASNSIGFTKAVNGMALCGFSDWSIPDDYWLKTLVDTSHTPAINPTFFPNTLSSTFWSSWPDTVFLDSAWLVNFVTGKGLSAPRGYQHSVRLMRGGSSFGTYALTVSATGNGSGNIASSIGGIHCTSSAETTSGACSGSLGSAVVILSATPSAGSSFTGWSGACSGSSLNCTLTMDAAKNVSAGFAVIAACAVSSEVATITANGYAFSHNHQAFDVLCQNGRYGVVRLPRGDNRTALETCAFQQSQCAKEASQCTATPAALALEAIYAGRNGGLALLDNADVGALARWICQK